MTKVSKWFSLGLASLTFALLAPPAFAQVYEEFVFPPSGNLYCVTQSGYWALDSSVGQYVWVPSQTVCESD